MAKRKYITLSTGYRVDINEPRSEEHLVNALVGECLTEIRNTTKPFDTLDDLGDAAARRMYQECEYLNRRYGMKLWGMMSEALNSMKELFERMGEHGEPDCINCEHHDECAQELKEQCHSEKPN